ncbi:MAG: hypothetical protein J6W61_01160 [Bacteroidales bacterium]|nr:hypothetical protein [Bacteroidales bacterium]
MTKRYEDVYKYVCKDMTLGEQKQVFGTCGLNNILKLYTKDNAISMAYNYLSHRDGIVEESRNENSNYISRRDKKDE